MSYNIQNTITGHRYAEMMVFPVSVVLKLEDDVDVIYLLHIA